MTTHPWVAEYVHMTSTARLRIKLRDNVIHTTKKSLGNISRDELARMMGVSTGTAYRVEKGTVDPSPAFIAALMVVSRKSFDDLFVIESDEDVAA